MYKVFFRDRTVFFKDNFIDTIRINSGLFYKFQSRAELFELLEAYQSLLSIRSLYIFHDNLDILRKEFTSFFKVIKASGGLVYNSKGEFLVIKRNGIWDLPKGKAEKGETSGETAVREVSEECGLESPELKQSLTKTYHTYILNGTAVLKETEWFEMFSMTKNTVPQSIEDITEVRWVNKSNASFILKNTFPSIVDVLTQAGIFKYPLLNA